MVLDLGLKWRAYDGGKVAAKGDPELVERVAYRGGTIFRSSTSALGRGVRRSDGLCADGVGQQGLSICLNDARAGEAEPGRKGAENDRLHCVTLSPFLPNLPVSHSVICPLLTTGSCP